MKIDRLIAAFAFVAGLGRFSRSGSDKTRCGRQQQRHRPAPALPESKIALIYSDAFLDPKTGIGRFNDRAHHT